MSAKQAVTEMFENIIRLRYSARTYKQIHALTVIRRVVVAVSSPLSGFVVLTWLQDDWRVRITMAAPTILDLLKILIIQKLLKGMTKWVWWIMN